jgi:hypothetical protein
MPQGSAKRDDGPGKRQFKLMLHNANLLYLSGSVLILYDRQYIGRLYA